MVMNYFESKGVIMQARNRGQIVISTFMYQIRGQSKKQQRIQDRLRVVKPKSLPADRLGTDNVFYKGLIGISKF